MAFGPSPSDEARHPWMPHPQRHLTPVPALPALPSAVTLRPRGEQAKPLPATSVTKARSMLGEKHGTLEPVFSSLKVSTCLWLEPPL